MVEAPHSPQRGGGCFCFVGEDSSNASIRTNRYQMKDGILSNNFEKHVFYRDIDFEIKMQC